MTGLFDLKLFQEPDIVFKDQPQVGDLELAHGQALQAHAEGPAGIDLRVDAAHLQHTGVLAGKTACNEQNTTNHSAPM